MAIVVIAILTLRGLQIANVFSQLRADFNES